MNKHLFAALAATSTLVAGAASAGVYKLDVTVQSEAGSKFSAPIFTFTNLSTVGQQVDMVGVSGGPPWDWVLNLSGPYAILDPAGGTRTLLEGEENTFDPNNGTTPAIRYGLTSFDSGDLFRFAADPEASNGSSAVIDIRQFLTGDLLTITAGFAGGPTLSGHDWTLEYVDPNGNLKADDNQIYRLTLEQSFGEAQGAVPEPATWGLMILGFGLVGARARSRPRTMSA